MRRCCTCGEEKSDEKFHWKNKSQGVRARICASCKNSCNQHWYQANSKEQIKNSAKNSARYKAAAVVLVNKAKNVPCADCGRKFPPVAMDFDHITGEKIAEISRLMKANIDKLRAEMAKCEVVCACCHRIRTERRRLDSLSQDKIAA
jgi:hypothetical protein